MIDRLDEYVKATEFLTNPVNKQKLQKWGVGPASQTIDMSKDMAISRKDSDLIVWTGEDGKALAASYHGMIEWYRASKVPQRNLDSLITTARGAFAITIDPQAQKKLDIRKIFDKPKELPFVGYTKVAQLDTAPKIGTEQFKMKVGTFKEWATLKEFDIKKDLAIKKVKAMRIFEGNVKNFTAFTENITAENFLEMTLSTYINITYKLLLAIREIKAININDADKNPEAIISKMTAVKGYYDQWNVMKGKV